MPFPFIPLALGGLSALGGLFGNKNRQTTDEQSSQTGTTTGSFDRTATEGFSPEFAGMGSDIIQKIFALSNPQTLDPAMLDRQELVEKNRVNMLSDSVLNSARGDQFSRGMANSPSGNGLSRGLAEMFRGSGLLDVSGSFAKRRFELPIQQQEMQSQASGRLAQLLSLLPQTQNTTGTETSNTVQAGNRTVNTTGKQGNSVMNAIAGGFTGFGEAGGFQDVPGLRRIFGTGQQPTGGTGDGTARIFRTPGFNPAANQFAFK